MKKFIFLLLVLLSNLCFGQITSVKTNGGTVVTRLGMGVEVNQSSTLMRDFIIVNDANCPIQLNPGFGVKTTYLQRYSFNLTGDFTPAETVVAYEFHIVLYNVFGEYIKTLSTSRVEDFETKTVKIDAQWYATENQISEYLFCVSYVAKVKTKNGTIWRYEPLKIKEELNRIKISYEESFTPKNE